MSVVKHWHRLSRETVDASVLESFKIRLDRVRNYLVQLKMSLLMAEGLN